jgi:N-acetylmuramoyl-L-alanine amidase
VVDIQTRLHALGFSVGREGADGHFGPHTQAATREFQQRRLLLADGIVGENTWTELVEAGYHLGERLLYLRVPFMRGDDVLALQHQLNELGFDSGPENGIFGPETECGLTEFQRNAGTNVDGIVGEATLAHLGRIRKAGVAEHTRKIPDRWNGYVGRATIEGMRVSIDAAHGGMDLGGVGHEGVREKEVNLSLAMRLRDVLEEAGAEALVTRDADRTMGLYERTAEANAWGPDLHVCIHHNYHSDTRMQGAATYYFANRAYFAESGKRLAGYVVRELVDQLGRVDLHTHGRNYACLREPRALAIMVEPGFITHPEEGRSSWRTVTLEGEARAVAAGIRAYLERR